METLDDHTTQLPLRYTFHRHFVWAGNIMGTTTFQGTMADHSKVTILRKGTGRRPKPSLKYIPPEPYYLKRVSYYGARGHARSESLDAAKNGTIFEYVGPSVEVEGNSSPNHFNELAAEAAFDSAHYNSALLKVREKLKKEQVQLGIAFAERGKTTKLLTNTLDTVVNVIRDLKRGRFRSAARRLSVPTPTEKQQKILAAKDLPGRWLEYQYGWKPLLSDVYGAAEALNELEPDDWLVTCKAWRGNKLDRSAVKSNITTWPWYGHYVNEQGCFIRVDYNYPNAGLHDLKQVGITNPLVIGWELVPFSFIADWFLPIGDWLGSLDATLGFEFRGISISKFLTERWYIEGISYDSPVVGATDWVDPNWRSTKQAVLVDRSCPPSLPIPEFPSLQKGLGLTRFANLMSVLVSLTSPKSR